MEIPQSRPFTEYLSLLAAGIPPQSLASATPTRTAKVDRVLAARAMWRLYVGVFGASATVDMKLQESVDGVTYTDVVPATAITQLLAGGGNNVQATIELDCDNPGLTKRYQAVLVTVGANATLLSVDVLADLRTIGIASFSDDPSVVQRKSLPTPIPVPVGT